MNVRILGARKMEAKGARHACFLIDDRLAVDAGGLTSALALDEQDRLQGVLMTHHHYDHCRDLPTLGLNLRDGGGSAVALGEPAALRVIYAHLLDGRIYSDSTAVREPGAPPPLALRPFAPGETRTVLGYEVSSVRVDHPVPTMGYVVSAGGMRVGFSGDTGGALARFFAHPTPPDVLLVDVSWPDRMRDQAEQARHLTPSMLRAEVLAAREAGLAIPRLIAVHRSLRTESELLRELAALQSDLRIDLEPGWEDMVISA